MNEFTVAVTWSFVRLAYCRWKVCSPNSIAAQPCISGSHVLLKTAHRPSFIIHHKQMVDLAEWCIAFVALEACAFWLDGVFFANKARLLLT